MVSSTSAPVVREDGCDDEALVSVLPLDGSSSGAAAAVSSATPGTSHRQLRKLVSRDDPLLPTDRLLPSTDRSADVTLSTSVFARYPESGLLRSSWMLGDGKNCS